jgi:ribosome modulation factor
LEDMRERRLQRETEAQAWSKGFEAGGRLLPSHSNPYKVGSDLHEAWFDGWSQGSDPDPEEMVAERRRA